MSSDKPQFVRKTISIPDDLWRRVEDFRFEQRIKNEAETIRLLLEKALADTRK